MTKVTESPSEIIEKGPTIKHPEEKIILKAMSNMESQLEDKLSDRVSIKNICSTQTP